MRFTYNYDSLRSEGKMDFRFLDINRAFFEGDGDIATKKKKLISTPPPLTTEMFKNLVKTDFFGQVLKGKQNVVDNSKGNEENKPHNPGIYDKAKTNTKKRKNPTDEAQNDFFFSSSSLLGKEISDYLEFSDFMNFGSENIHKIENQVANYELVKNCFQIGYESFFEKEEQRFRKKLKKKEKVSENHLKNGQFAEESVETNEKETLDADFKAPKDKKDQKIQKIQ